MAPKRNYSQEQMIRAIDEVKRGEKVSVAATKYGVPRITLRNKVKGISPLDCNLGPSTVLSKEEEKVLVKWVLFMAENHFPVTKDHLLDSVQKIILEKNLVNCPFTNNRPGKKWFTSFLNRHPELAQRTAQNLTKAREDVTEEELNQWFQTIKTYIEGKGLSDALKDPSRIYNTDESAFYLQPKAGRVLVRKGEKNVYSSSGDEKENLTVLITANAAGVMAPPMIVYPYERIPTLIVKSVPRGWGIGRSETGWMCAKTFYEFITNVFNPWLIQKDIPKPVVFFLDGHKSHMSLHLANFCRDNGIELIALFPNSTHLIQPMDVAVFRPLKISWRVQVMKWKSENPGARLKKEDFAPNLQEALKGICPDTIKNGFRKSGLYPFSSEYVDMTKIASRSRTIRSQPSQTEDTIKKKQFMQTLETEIQKVFSSEKVTLFNKLYFMPRGEVENLLPDEDQSLYIIWAKTKNILTGTLPISTDNDNMTCQQQPSQIIETDYDLTTSVVSKDLPQITAQNDLTTSVVSTDLPQTTAEYDLAISVVSKDLPQITAEYDLATSVVSKDLPQITAEYDLATSIVSKDLPQITAEYDLTTSVASKDLPQITDDSNAATATSSRTDISTPPIRTQTQTHQNPSVSPTTDGSNAVTATTTSSTPLKTNFTSKLSASTTTPIGDIPSPFKRALYWPEPEIKKRRIKERLPSAITSDPYIDYVEKKENEKKRKIEEKERRAKERKEKQLLREKLKQEKKINNENKKGKAKTKAAKSTKRKQVSSSSSEEINTDIEYQDSEYDLEEDLSESGSEEDTITLKTLALSQKQTKSKYVIIKYEGEYFPGIIKKAEGKQYEIGTMVLSKNNTFRWPETPDQIWYDEKAIIEFIKEPVLINKRGFYKVEEMNKYLPFVL